METSKKISIAIIARNPLFSEMLKKSMFSLLPVNEEVDVHTFAQPEMFFKEVESNLLSPDIIVLDYVLSKQPDEEQPGKKHIERIRRITPETSLIVISEEKNMEEAARTLQYGAHEFVLKDKFVFSHITSAIKGCLNPSKS